MPYPTIELQIDQPNNRVTSEIIKTIVSQQASAFVILQRTKMSYIQAVPNLLVKGTHLVEYQEGSLKKHYSATVDTETLVRMFKKYAAGADTWKGMADWEKVAL